MQMKYIEGYTEGYIEGYTHLCMPLAAILCCKSCQYMLRMVSITETLRSITTLFHYHSVMRCS